MTHKVVPSSQCDHRTKGVYCPACHAGYVKHADTASWSTKPRLSVKQHEGIARALAEVEPGMRYLRLRARFGALVLLGASYGIDWDGDDWVTFLERVGDAAAREARGDRALKALEHSDTQTATETCPLREGDVT